MTQLLAGLARAGALLPLSAGRPTRAHPTAGGTIVAELGILE
jgi:hypothetical protein